jgi:hypothetical protein
LQTHTPLEASKPGTCRRGHPWTVANTYVHPTGRHHCRQCHAAANRERRKKS